MRRSDRSPKKQPEIENEAHGKLKAKKSQSEIMIKKSLVSKHFRNVILTHRYKLAFLFVHSIEMNQIIRSLDGIKIFDKLLSPYAYNGWVVRNHYSKQVALEDEEYENKFYMLSALADYKDPNFSYLNVFEACVRLSSENWPMFQHFVRLFTDPYIYIRSLRLIFQVDVLNLLTKAINSDDNRVQCKELVIHLIDDSRKFIKWVKDHTCCDKFRIYYSGSNNDDEFLDLFMTGAYCTSEVNVEHYDLCKVVVAFVQHFMDLKSCDENQMVQSIRGNFSDRSVEVVKRNYAEVLVKEERNNSVGIIDQVFEFVNNDIGKKLNLIVANHFDRMKEFSLKIAFL